jgi:hypothetical protein
MMNIQPVRSLPAETMFERTDNRDCRVNILAIGVISSAIVMINIQPPIGVILYLTILVMTLAIVFPKEFASTNKTVYVANQETSYWRYPFYPKFKTPEFLESPRRTFKIGFPRREPVGRKENDFQYWERVPVGEK